MTLTSPEPEPTGYITGCMPARLRVNRDGYAIAVPHVHCGKCGEVATTASDKEDYRSTVCKAEASAWMRERAGREWTGGVLP
jgi:hypothetical protein